MSNHLYDATVNFDRAIDALVNARVSDQINESIEKVKADLFFDRDRLNIRVTELSTEVENLQTIIRNTMSQRQLIPFYDEIIGKYASDGKWINAIKDIRDKFGYSLKEAKDIVDQYRDHNGYTGFTR